MLLTAFLVGCAVGGIAGVLICCASSRLDHAFEPQPELTDGERQRILDELGRIEVRHAHR